MTRQLGKSFCVCWGIEEFCFHSWTLEFHFIKSHWPQTLVFWKWITPFGFVLKFNSLFSFYCFQCYNISTGILKLSAHWIWSISCKQGSGQSVFKHCSWICPWYLSGFFLSGVWKGGRDLVTGQWGFPINADPQKQTSSL